jgi:hypothetical protein
MRKPPKQSPTKKILLFEKAALVASNATDRLKQSSSCPMLSDDNLDAG